MLIKALLFHLLNFTFLSMFVLCSIKTQNKSDFQTLRRVLLSRSENRILIFKVFFYWIEIAIGTHNSICGYPELLHIFKFLVKQGNHRRLPLITKFKTTHTCHTRICRFCRLSDFKKLLRTLCLMPQNFAWKVFLLDPFQKPEENFIKIRLGQPVGTLQ